jgi:mannitol-1-/sugar-/sorbitol-6-phosphatase
VVAIVFDLDGVLVDSTAAVERAWGQWAAERGIAVDELLAVVHGRPSREVIARFAPELDAVAEAKRLDSMEEVTASPAIPGAAECIALAQEGAWAVVTSGDGRAPARLRAAGLPVPDVLITADDVTNGKPDPEPYARAAEALGVPAAECVVVEDAPAGITAAKRAGMRVIAVATSSPAAALGEADLVLASMHEVLPELSRTAASRGGRAGRSRP